MKTPLVMGPYERLLWRWLFRLAPAALVVLSAYKGEWDDVVLFWYAWGVVVRISRILSGEAPNKATARTVLVPFYEPLVLARRLLRKAVSRITRQPVGSNQS